MPWHAGQLRQRGYPRTYQPGMGRTDHRGHFPGKRPCGGGSGCGWPAGCTARGHCHTGRCRGAVPYHLCRQHRRAADHQLHHLLHGHGSCRCGHRCGRPHTRQVAAVCGSGCSRPCRRQRCRKGCRAGCKVCPGGRAWSI
nr:MAG TPA: hypothetical protein [Caudoviricetes sp.]